jgi:hypothetical protein
MLLREEQKILFDSFSRRSATLGDIYLGGLRILADETNPFRSQLAAHAFRELLDHLAKSSGAVVIKGDNLPTRLMRVRRAFDALREPNGATAASPKDPALLSTALHEELSKLFTWQDENQPQRKKRVAVMLTQLAGPGPALPSDVTTQEVSAWIESQDYFNSVAHGGKRVERDEFLGRLYAAEEIILRRVKPRPLSELDEIDALIEEGENAD